ncbi:MAG TPA: HemK/PrmC family methyltransferase [Actinomycetota bacterium]
MNETMDVDALLKLGKRTLRANADNLSWTGNLHNEAFDLLEMALGHYPVQGEVPSAATRRKFQRLIERRASGEPQPYILGWCEFGPLKMKVKQGGFVPRTTSEFLSQQAARRIARRRRPVAVDLATGVGPVALLVKKLVGDAQVYGADISRSAIAQARANAKDLGLDVTFRVGDLFAPLPGALCGEIDVITMHPPYVGAEIVEDLPAEIKDYEPPESLTDGSNDGLGLVRRVVAEGRNWLRSDGWLMFEVEPPIARPVRTLLTRGGYTDVKSTTDPELPITRVVIGRKP